MSITIIRQVKTRKVYVQELKRQVNECTNCNLHATRLNPVFGSGDEHADIMIIGEGPGEQEDQEALPFVGSAGQNLTGLITRAGLNRPDLYIANIVKCRPPKNAEPIPAQVTACRPYLEAQIASVKPKAIVCIGRTASQKLLQTKTKLDELISSNPHVFISGSERIPVFCTWHTSALSLNRAKERRDDVVAVFAEVKSLISKK